MSRNGKRNKVGDGGLLTRIGYGHNIGQSPFYNNPVSNQVALTEALYLRRFTELRINSFQWHNLPDEISERYLEMQLNNNALAVFFYDDHYQKYMALNGQSQGFLDYQDEPNAFQITANQSYRGKVIKAANCVPIWANRTRHPDNDVMLWYARRLAEVETTVDINIKSARLARVLAVSENMRLSGENFIRQIDEGNPVIKVDETFMSEGVLSVLDMGVDPDNILSVQMVKNRLYNDCMTFLGVNNSNQDKKERLVSDEVDANGEQVLLNRAIALGARKLAAKAINKKFNLNVRVDWNDELKADIDPEDEPKEPVKDTGDDE